MIDIQALRRKCLPVPAVLRFNSSRSNSSNPVTNMDAQVGASDQGVAIGVQGTGNTLTLTDQGAVKGALELATRGIEGAQLLASTATAAQGGILEGALKMSAAQNEQFAGAMEKVKTADVRTLVIVGMAVVGLGAAVMFKKGG